MFNIGMSEMILVFIVALIVFGPDRLPEIARTLGKSVNELKKMGNDIVDAATETKDTAKKRQSDRNERSRRVVTKV